MASNKWIVLIQELIEDRLPLPCWSGTEEDKYGFTYLIVGSNVTKEEFDGCYDALNINFGENKSSLPRGSNRIA